MRRTRAPDNAVALPAMVDTETGGYYTAGPPATVFSADDANTIQEELVAIATMKGASLDTTGANLDQCAEALEGVKAIEAKGVEATAVTSYWKLTAIASTDATIGEDDGGVVHAAAIASDSCKARGFESAAIASEDCNAGNAAGTSNHVAVIASNKVEVEGDESAAIASECTISGTATSTATRGVMLASGWNGSGTKMTGTDVALIATSDGQITGSPVQSAALASTNPTIQSSNCLVAASNYGTASGIQAAVIGAYLSSAGGDRCGILGGTGHITSADNSAIVGGDTNSISVDGTDSVIAGGSDNYVQRAACFFGATRNSKIPSSASSVGVAALASRYLDVDLAGTEENYMVVGGYDAGTTHVAPSWKIESNGGTLHATNTTVQALDYAELFKNADEKAHPPGSLLTLAGRGCRLARRGQRVLGVVSACPNVIGGSDSLGWSGQWATDEWGAAIWDEAEEVNKLPPNKVAVVEARMRQAAFEAVRQEMRHEIKNASKRVAAAEEDGERAELMAIVESLETALAQMSPPDLSDLDIKPRESRRMVRVRRMNPEWDRARAKTHTPRTKRPDEWTVVGLLGQVRVAVDDTVTEGDFVEPGDTPGIGARAAGNGPAPGRPIECMEITSPFDPERGYAIALCLVG